MKQYTTTVTKRGQVTLPAEVRQLLGTKPRDKVKFIVDGDQVCLSPVEFSLESAFGSVRPSKRPEDFEEISRLAKGEKAERAARKLRRGR
ncbi:MAG: AbrB/MazE/SpoVT family DNA-binding domain-containing protein [Chloroflexi bacterium]|nr:AbrB/MazE/SpoVT family DNA-binding domain-containing protein [Chloroflexota bacterium]